LDAQGRLHIHTNINDKGSTAVGLTSGTTYHEVGTTRENVTEVESLPTTVSFVNVLEFIGQGSAPNLAIQERFHLTVNASGVVTVERETERITCK
jgi:hypothetical protein